VCLAHCAVVFTYDVSMRLARCRFVGDRATFAWRQQPLWDAWSEAVRSPFRVGADSVAWSEGENDRVSWTADSGAGGCWETDTAAEGKVDCSVLLLVFPGSLNYRLAWKIGNIFCTPCGVVGSLVTVLLQSFSWFWQWMNCENRLIFDKVKAYNNGANFWATLYCT